MFFDGFVTAMLGAAVPRSLLFVELGMRPTREVRRGFSHEGFKVDTASGLVHAQSLTAIRTYNGSLIFGTTLDRILRCVETLTQFEDGRTRPIVCMADLDEAEEIEILEAGGTLCLPAATSFTEALAHLRILFDVAEGFPVHYRIRDLGIDPIARRASLDGRPLALRPREFDLLVYLAEHAGRAVPVQEIHEAFWPKETFSSSRIAIHMHHLRRAIDARRMAPLLHTVRGGYKLSAARLAG